MTSSQELEPAGLVIVYGRGLEPNGDMSEGTLGRIQAGMAYAESHDSVRGVVVSGGYSKWQLEPPDGATEAGHMIEWAAEHHPDVPILGSDTAAKDTFDNAINTARILAKLGIKLGPNFRAAMPMGDAHAARVLELTALANGLNPYHAKKSIEHVRVEEDGPFDHYIEKVGLWVLHASVDAVGGVMPGDLEQLARAHRRFDEANVGLQGSLGQKVGATLKLGGAVALRSVAAYGEIMAGVAGRGPLTGF